jgi:hypothetical protein
MKTRPILCSTSVVQSLLLLKKTQTRRLRGLNEINYHPDYYSNPNNLKRTHNRIFDGDREKSPNPISTEYGLVGPFGNIIYHNCPYGQEGDILYVRESFKYCQPYGCESLHYNYKGSYGPTINVPADAIPIMPEYDKWKPSIHMPRTAARVWLKITNIRLERLQDISEKDAQAEGVEFNGEGYKVYVDVGLEEYELETAYWSFNSLWCSINGGESWEHNPWVWVVEFENISTNGKPYNII